MLKKFLTGLSTALMVIAISAALLFGWSKTGWKALAIPTGSMEPTISQGSLAVVHHVSPESLKVGDVITYTDPLNPGRTISHRIIKTYMLSGTVRTFVTKGDANKFQDIPVTSGSVLGRVTVHVPQLGALLLGGKTWVGLAVLVYLPAMMLIIEEIRRMANYLKLAVPYKLYGYRISRQREPVPRSNSVKTRYAAATMAASLVLIASLAFGPPVFALLKSNPVVLRNNVLTRAATTTPPGGGTGTTTTTTTNITCTNNTNVNYTNTNGQTASSGNASSSGNTTGGTATSGSASNSNLTNVNVNVTGGC